MHPESGQVQQSMQYRVRRCRIPGIFLALYITFGYIELECINIGNCIELNETFCHKKEKALEMTEIIGRLRKMGKNKGEKSLLQSFIQS
jgi:hypothetical protein